MITMASQITSLTMVNWIVYSGADLRKHQSSAHWPLWGDFTCDREFSAQRASNAENVSIRWRHHDLWSVCYRCMQQINNYPSFLHSCCITMSCNNMKTCRTSSSRDSYAFRTFCICWNEVGCQTFAWQQRSTIFCWNQLTYAHDSGYIHPWKKVLAKIFQTYFS